MPASLVGKLADPEFRTKRARKAGQASHSVDAHIKRIVDAWPELTTEQRLRLAQLFVPDSAAQTR